MNRRRIVVALGWLAFALGTGGPAAAQNTLAPDVIFTNAKFVTVNARFDIVEALAVRDGRIVAVGTANDVRRLASPATRIVDLGGKTVLPGFYNGHAHVGPGEEDTRILDWRAIDSREALLSNLRREVAERPAGDWILAALQNEKMPQERLPTRWHLDGVTPDNPVVLFRGHITVGNSLAMEKSGITRETTIAEGGAIDRNDAGEPIGWFREGAGQRAITAGVPPPPPLPDEKAHAGIRDQLTRLLSLGITSVNMPGVLPGALRWVQDVYARWGAELPRGTIQVRMRPGFDSYDDIEEGIAASIKEIEGLSFHTGFGNDRLKIGAIKMSIDGGFSSAAFWSLESYPSRPGYKGLQRIPEEALYRVGKRAHDLGWQLGIHAIGDAAVVMTTNVLARILEENPRADHRHHIHHLSVMPPEDTLKKIADLGIIVCSQPNFTYSLGPFNASPGLSPAKLQTNNPQRTLLRHGIRLAYGSDGMPLDPLTGIYAAVTRRGVDGKVYGPAEALTVQEAIRAYTAGTAYLTFDENGRGTLEVGKVADLVVLGEDILQVDPERIRTIPVLQTIVAGEVLYTAPKQGNPSAAR
jgi:predicted amidohydrolase YtcJ